MALPAVQVNHKQKIMRTIYIVIALATSLAFVTASAQDKSSDTTARFLPTLKEHLAAISAIDNSMSSTTKN